MGDFEFDLTDLFIIFLSEMFEIFLFETLLNEFWFVNEFLKLSRSLGFFVLFILFLNRLSLN